MIVTLSEPEMKAIRWSLQVAIGVLGENEYAEASPQKSSQMITYLDAIDEHLYQTSARAHEEQYPIKPSPSGQLRLDLNS